MRVFLYCFLIMVALSCKRSEVTIVEQDTVPDQYPDWYTLKAPIDHEIVGVWGNYDKTILISTMSRLFRTTDQGKHWEQVHKQSIGIFGIVQYQDTLFTMSGLSSQAKKEVHQQVLIHADNYSVRWLRKAAHIFAQHDAK
ncbi:hypothetical protein [Dyadobacter sp. MSC1_007]|jgi:hypothetical protein|uniref:hypothetical protein n=1 Tax=Dyadobacter sp. MSC1_007 TaxID=2909264 RepID=UPI00202F2000|nr:hypothetical protein [Dyadobacter sp. MSC1_007]